MAPFGRKRHFNHLNPRISQTNQLQSRSNHPLSLLSFCVRRAGEDC